MPDVKISALPSNPLDGTEIVPTVDGGVTSRTTAAAIAALAPIQDHGTLTGLADDDHTQYHNNARGDARYSLLSHVHAAGTPSVAGFISTSDKTKLDGIVTGATANATDAALRDRATHTGAQAISTITALQTALDNLAFSGARVYRNSALAFTVSSATVYSPNTELLDVGDWWDAGSPTLLVVPADVSYVEVVASMIFVLSGTVRELVFNLDLKKNGTLIRRVSARSPLGINIGTDSTGVTLVMNSGPIDVAAADEFSLEITIIDVAGTGYNAATIGSSLTEYFAIRRIG